MPTATPVQAKPEAQPAPKTADPKYREGFRDGFRSASMVIARLVGQLGDEDKARMSKALERIDTELLALDTQLNGAPKPNGAAK